MANKPQVSVCIPTYNRTQYLKEAIQSVLDQTFTDFELIIVDNASEEDVGEVVRSFQDDRIRYHRNAENIGMVGNWNRCIELAQGEYITIFHDDDVMLPDNLIQKVQVLNQHPDVGLVYSNVQQIDQKGQVLSEHWQIEQSKSYILPKIDSFKQLALSVTLVCCPSVIIRRQIYELLGRFDNRLTHAVDLEMWLRIALFYDVAYLADTLIQYRWHDSNETYKCDGYIDDLNEVLRAIQFALENQTGMIADMEALRRVTTKNIAQLAFDRAYSYYQRYDYIGTTKCLGFALKTYPVLIINSMKDKRTIEMLAKLILREKGTELMKDAKNLVFKLIVSS